MAHKDDSQTAETKAINNKASPMDDIDLDKLKNEFHEVDFHPMESKPPDKYMYSVYFDNV